MCLYPRLIKNRKYIPNIKNNGNPPSVKDERTKYVPVGCGNCIECRKLKSREWQVRLNEEIKDHKYKYFVTLTFNERSLQMLTEEILKSNLYHKDEDNEIATLAVRRFLERWRKKYGKSIRHWLITELGHTGTERIHLHGIMFTKDNIEALDIPYLWNYGIVDLGKYVNEKTVNYIVKYVTKVDNNHKGYKPKILSSKGIGSNYLNRIDSKRNKYNGNETKEYYTTKTGLKLNLPTYYRNKLYTEDEKENLWIMKLDKNIRWIMGEKVDISIDEYEYYDLLKYYQSKNIRLGYGDLSSEWDIKLYRRRRANLKKQLKNLKHGKTSTNAILGNSNRPSKGRRTKT